MVTSQVAAALYEDPEQEFGQTTRAQSLTTVVSIPHSIGMVESCLKTLKRVCSNLSELLAIASGDGCIA
jgi:hypothetical protein